MIEKKVMFGAHSKNSNVRRSDFFDAGVVSRGGQEDCSGSVGLQVCENSFVDMSAQGLVNLCNLLSKHKQWNAQRAIFEEFFVFYTSVSGTGHQRAWISKNTKHKNVRSLIESLCFHLEQNDCAYKYKEFSANFVKNGGTQPHVHVFEVDFESVVQNALAGIVEPDASPAKSFCGESVLTEFELPNVLYSFEALTFFSPALCTKSNVGSCSVC